MRRVMVLILLAAFSLGLRPLPQVQGGLEVADVQVTYNFGEQITFQARLVPSAAITQASILFRDLSEVYTRVQPLAVGADGATRFRYDAAQNVLRPFATIVFWYQAGLAGGQTITSPFFYFRYGDNRFPWRETSNGPLTVHWYAGGDAFGQAALDSARAGLEAADQLVPAPLDASLDVYVYAAPEDLRGALVLGGEEWAAGRADPALGVVMVSVAPGEQQGIELERQIPHELAHVLLYRSVGAGYNRLPAWLNEGIASLVEVYPNPDYAQALNLASQNSSLLPFADLCASFPPDSGRAFLAYAQSESFVRYLRDMYGTTGLVALVRAYADGLDCEIGATRAVGLPLSQLDARWRESALGENISGVAARNLLPYIILLGLTLIVPVWGAIDTLRERRRSAPKPE